jgi:hypothetical protein
LILLLLVDILTAVNGEIITPSGSQHCKIELPDRLKHKPVALLPYEAHDGPYVGDTDCRYLSVGWAQYDPRTLSAKALRYTNGRWSRQSEELPLHRAIDLTSMIVHTLQASLADGRVDIAPQTLEHQNSATTLTLRCGTTEERALFDALIQDPLVRRRLTKLADALGVLRARNEI